MAKVSSKLPVKVSIEFNLPSADDVNWFRESIDVLLLSTEELNSPWDELSVKLEVNTPSIWPLIVSKVIP